MMMKPLTQCLLAVWLASATTVAAQPRPLATTPDGPVVLLVHGLKQELHVPLTVWGVKTRGVRGDEWSGLIGRLAAGGRRFGGVIRPQAGRLRLPDHLETASTSPAAARVFALGFSETANVDGLAFKALELAESLREIRRFTGQRRIQIVAHSGGGLVVRALLQRALPGLDDIPSVERVITIATPHLGSALAEHWGDYFGTRASSLKPTAGLIRRLNDDLDLPTSTAWASIIVRGTSIGTTGIRLQEPLIVPLLRRDVPLQLPLDLVHGGDQVVDVRSQNLALSRCAERYERLTKRPIVTLVARVPDPTPADRTDHVGIRGEDH